MQALYAVFSRKSPASFRVSVALSIVICLVSISQLVMFAFAAPPVITNVATSTVLSNGATITWSTDVVADSQIEYGLSTAYGSTTTLAPALVSSHSQAITGLQANQLYNFQVKSRDSAGNVTVSGNRTFITASGPAAPGPDTDSGNSNTMNATRFTTTYGGKLQSLSAYVGAIDSSTTNRNFQMAIYTVSGSVPGTLVANSASGTLTANSWNTVPVTATLAPGTSYFIAYNTNGRTASVNNLRSANGGTSVWRTSGQTFGTWPASFGGATAQNVTFSMYASYANDSNPPTVSLTAPVQNTALSGTATVAASATDDNAVSSVEFKSGETVLGVDATEPYAIEWDTTRLINSTQTLIATATDTSGNTTASTPIQVNLVNQPKVLITGPGMDQNIASTAVTITYAKAGDWLAGDGKHVHFRLDGGPTKMDLNSDGDQTYTLLDVPGGNHTLEAIVADGSHVELAGSGMTVSFSTTAPDTTPPTVSLTAPADGSAVLNTITITAEAADDRAITGVQFLLDGNNLGAEDNTAPYTVSWNTTTVGNGTHTLTARARDSVNQTTSAPISVNVQNTDPRATVGEWSSVMNWPLVAVHGTLFHTGDILMWDAWENPTTNAKLWNPATNIFTDVPVNGGLFCSGHATTSTGELLVMGGHNGGEVGIKNVTSFNPVTRTWTRKPDMQYARWYPSVTQLPDNRMLTFSGQITSGNFANTPEVFTPKTNTIASLPITTPELREVQYPQTSVLPNGKVLAISTEQGGVMLYDPSNAAWTQAGTTQVPYGVWTSFAPGKYLITGGGTDFSSYNPSNPGPSQKTTRVLDMTSGAPVWSPGGAMHNGRSFHNVTMLPTGKAIAIGGSTTVNDFSTTGTQTAEQWNPDTNTWSQLANPARSRMYHSISILLPDGRILSAGGGRLSPAPDQLNAQIYSPPYLFQGPRPTITSAPTSITHNSTMDLISPDAAEISKVTLVNLGSVTHTADWNQRFMELPFTRNGDTLTVNTPANANIAAENYYMVFAVNSTGVPSVAKIVKLETPDLVGPIIANVQASNLSSAAATVSWTTDEAADSQIEYGPTTAYGTSTTLDTTMVTSHFGTLSGLTANTPYHYRVKSRDAAGNLTVSGDYTFTTPAPDTQAPSVLITAPTSGTVSNTVTVTANASDTVGVTGVQFKLDGNNLGSEDTNAPYSTSWNTAQTSNGTHTLTAVARDAAGNVTTSASVTVTVSNTGGGGLVAAYNFNEGTGSVVNDLSGNSNNGSIFQATWFSTGKFGKALTFDGTNDVVTVNASSNLDLTTAMTLESWVRPTVTNGGWRTALLKENGSQLAYALYAKESTNKPSGWMSTESTGSQSAGATPGLAANTWSHLAVTYDGFFLRLYVNGTLRASTVQTGNMRSSTGPLKFGGNAIWGEYFKGQLDEIRIYNRALTQTEIQTNMNQAL